MKRWIIKNIDAMLAVIILLLLLVMVSSCSTTSVITTYDADGKIVKIEEVETGALDKLVSSVKDKTLVIWKSGWACYVSASPATFQDPTPTIKVFAGKMDEGYVSLHKEQKGIDWEGVAKVVNATNKTLKISPNGVKEEKK